jgi:hypothetical protein
VVRKFRGHDAAVNAVRSFLADLRSGLCLFEGVFTRFSREEFGVDGRGASLKPACFDNQTTTNASILIKTKKVTHAAEDEVLVTGGYDASAKVWDRRSRSAEAVQTLRGFKVCEG